jgi:hypothetical protein
MTLKKTSSGRRSKRKEMRWEYRFDYRKSRPNRFASRRRGEAVAIMLDPDVAAVFGSSQSVNSFLRSVINALPKDTFHKYLAERQRMTHTILYYGRYNQNFERLRKYEGPFRDFRVLDGKGRERQRQSPSKKVDGIVFGYMEKAKEGLPARERFFAVSVGDVVLEHPTVLKPDSHTDGKWFGPQPSQFGAESAKQLLTGIIEANTAQRTELLRIHHEFFGQL